jgi:enoyl-CoA hydratase
MEGILAALDAEAARGEGASGGAARNGADAAFARTLAALLRTKSPTSLKVTLALLRRSRILDFDQCMRTEFRVASRLAKGHDLYEGIRSVIIDKDRAPRWQPSSLQEVGQGDVEGHFASIAAELDLP